MFLYPIFLDVARRRCLVIGAGPVGLRKADGLRRAGAVVRIVAPDPPGDLAPFPILALSPPDRLEWVRAEYQPAHLEGVSLVFAAGPSEVNARVVADARARGLWVNSASDPEAGDFTVPAVRLKRGIQIAVGTGAVPALAARIADTVSETLDNGWDLLASLLFVMRDEIKQRVPKAARAELWRRLSDPIWLDRLRSDGPVAVQAKLRALVDAAAGS